MINIVRCKGDMKYMLGKRATILRKKELEEVGFKERFKVCVISWGAGVAQLVVSKS